MGSRVTYSDRKFPPSPLRVTLAMCPAVAKSATPILLISWCFTHLISLSHSILSIPLSSVSFWLGIWVNQSDASLVQHAAFYIWISGDAVFMICAHMIYNSPPIVFSSFFVTYRTFHPFPDRRKIYYQESAPWAWADRETHVAIFPKIVRRYYVA